MTRAALSPSPFPLPGASAVYLHGRGLVSALGPDIPAALSCLQHGGVEPAALEVGPGIVWPYFAINDAAPDWYARARQLVRQAVAECGDVDRSAPLYLASCSLDVGAVEAGQPFLADCQAFAEIVAGWLDWQGLVYWFSSACSSANNALLSAARCLHAGDATHALVLGLELRNRFTSAGFGAMGLLDTQRPRPLAADRGGLVLGEAVAALWLGSTPARWRIAGGANVVDGRDAAGAAPEAVALMTRRALAEAGLQPGDIGLVKLQAAGSPANDAAEIAGLHQVFDERPALTTLKAELGHTLGASGAAELALLTACLEQDACPAPRTAPAAEFALTLSTQARPRYLLANILGFGGGHATLLLEDCTRSPDAGHRPESGTNATNIPGFRCASSGLRNWQILGRHIGTPQPDWREQLAARLGYKPRRIGAWAELALHGALVCLSEAGETTLPAAARLWLASLHGPDQALRAALLEAQDGQPLPLGFLQSQPNQVLAHLAKALDWQGDACCVSQRDPLSLLRLACSGGIEDVLLGWVDEASGRSDWLRLRASDQAFAPLGDISELADPARQGFALARD